MAVLQQLYTLFRRFLLIIVHSTDPPVPVATAHKTACNSSERVLSAYCSESRSHYREPFKYVPPRNDSLTQECSATSKPDITFEAEMNTVREVNVDGKLAKIAEIIAQQANNGETAAHNELSFATEDLIVYLNSQVYTSAPFGGYSGPYGGGFGHSSDENAKNDIVNLVKTEIRNVKGAVLNM